VLSANRNIALVGVLLCFIYGTSYPAEIKEKRFEAGVGVGYLYGVFGINLEMNIVNNLGLVAGGGYANKFKWFAGAKYYFLPARFLVRPRITIGYGTNSMVEYRFFEQYENGHSTGTFTELDEGVLIGAGAKLMFGRKKTIGIDLDFTYGLTHNFKPIKFPGKKITETKPQAFFFSVGFRYSFDLF